MRTGLSFVLVAVLALSTLQGTAAGSSGTCAGCTIVVGLVERMALNLGVPIAAAVDNLCTDLSPKVDWIAALCADALQLFVPEIETDFKAGKNPDWTCINTLALCKDFPTCNLYKVWPPPESTPTGPQSLQKVKKSYGDTLSTVGMVMAGQAMMFPANPPAPTGDVVDHLPLIDLDNDYFSTIPTLRGIHWRGRDCNDLDATIYPGRSKNTHPAAVDHNCNGIKGADVSGVSFEDKYCKGTGQLGLIALGDSATAHFHIPPDWLDAVTMDNETWANLIPYAEDELDFPQCSSSVGFESNANCPASDLPVDSLYLRLRARNLCNHRDYQNIGVNGGSSGNMQPPKGIVVSMKSRNGTDQPALVVYALIGNDVCGHHADFDHMTTPDEFEKNTLNSLAYLDEHLVAGSHVVLVGLVDGRVLFNTMAKEQHPAGVTYETLYDYLNCLDTSPCWGWMNSNETVRNKTSDIAASLNLRYPKIMKEHTYKNFDMHYIDSVKMMNDVIAEWIKEGHNPVDLIEPADGFHPSQTTNALFASNIWNDLATNAPSFIGSVNPNNAAIKAQFGDQGGYYTDS